MTRVLVLGGTGWLGHEIAREWVDSGAEVTCLARGVSGGTPRGATLVVADRRDPTAYSALEGDWDEVVELSYERELVESALVALGARAAHWTLVSTVSVYARNDEPDADETAEVVEPRDPGGYADAKVVAERLVLDRLGDRLLVARPGLVVGPGDPSDRFGYWPARFAQAGPVLTPVPEGRFIQVIDVGDLAAWIRAAGEALHRGVVNAVGTAVTMADFFAVTRDVAGFTGETVQMTDEDLLAKGVQYWAGPRSLPLWLPVEDTGFAQRSNAAFLANGGGLRPLAQTIHRSLTYEVSAGLTRERRAGLTLQEEAEVLR